VRTTAFIAGSLLPDVPIYTFFIVQGLILGTSQALLWDVLYFDSAWTPFFTLSHSLILWPLGVVLGCLFGWPILRWVATAGTLHVGLDFLVHHSDAYRHFWPITDWIFRSPISYYEPEYFGPIVNLIDAVLVIGLLAWLYTLYQTNWVRIPVCTGLFFYALVIGVTLVSVYA
jgi:hypothetical protein